MSIQGKGSAKKGKPSYIMSIIGVTIVLFFIGIFGWLFLTAENYLRAFKNDVKMNAYISNKAKSADIDSFKTYINSQPYIKSIRYIDKEEAKRIMIGEGAFDTTILQNENPLPTSFELTFKTAYVQKDSLEAIRTDIINRPMVIENVDYPKNTVANMAKVAKYILLGLLTLSILFSILSIILIDNTIRLAMYSNRFLIKTMQMVGATRQFISKPLNIRAIINGCIAAAIAIALVYLVILGFESQIPIPNFREFKNPLHLILLFLFLLLLGIGITLFSTNRSITKYLKMKLDELY